MVRTFQTVYDAGALPKACANGPNAGQEAATQPDEDQNRKGEFVRRTVLALSTVVTALIMGSGVAMAAAVSGSQGNDTLQGTNGGDQIYGLNGNDTLRALRGFDELYGGAGNDELYGGPGDDEIYGGSGNDNLFGGDGRDFINSADRRFDFINCGGSDGVPDKVVKDMQDETRGC